jgi:hypothetical protein
MANITLKEKEMREIYPLTIVSDRYSGTYSGGIYTAWLCNACDLPDEITDSDESCAAYWAEHADDLNIGHGNTPNEALEDLYNRIHGIYVDPEVKPISEEAYAAAFGSSTQWPDWLEVEEDSKVYRVGSNGNTVIFAYHDDDPAENRAWQIFFNIWDEEGNHLHGGYFEPEVSDISYLIDFTIRSFDVDKHIDTDCYVELVKQ